MIHWLCPNRTQAGWLVLRVATCDLDPQLQLNLKDAVAQVKQGQAPWPAQGQRHTGLGRAWGKDPAGGGAGFGPRSRMQMEVVTRAADTRPPARGSWRISTRHRSNRYPWSGTQTRGTLKSLLEKVRTSSLKW